MSIQITYRGSYTSSRTSMMEIKITGQLCLSLNKLDGRMLYRLISADNWTRCLLTFKLLLSMEIRLHWELWLAQTATHSFWAKFKLKVAALIKRLITSSTRPKIVGWKILDWMILFKMPRQFNLVMSLSVKMCRMTALPSNTRKRITWRNLKKSLTNAWMMQKEWCYKSMTCLLINSPCMRSSEEKAAHTPSVVVAARRLLLKLLTNAASTTCYTKTDSIVFRQLTRLSHTR